MVAIITVPTLVPPPELTGAVATLTNTANTHTGLLNVSALFNVDATNTSHTLASAHISGAPVVVLDMTGVLGAGINLTLPTVAVLVAAMASPAIGQTWFLRIINRQAGAFAHTVVTATGWTLTGTMTIANLTYRDFTVKLDSLTAATLQSLGQIIVAA